MTIVLYQWQFYEIFPYFGEDNLELLYMNTDPFVFFNHRKRLLKGLKQPFKDLDLTKIHPTHASYSEHH